MSAPEDVLKGAADQLLLGDPCARAASGIVDCLVHLVRNKDIQGLTALFVLACERSGNVARSER